MTSICIPTLTCGLPLQDVGGTLASGAAKAVLAAVSGSIAEAASWLTREVMSLAVSPTAPSMDAGWFRTQLPQMEVVMLMVVTPMLMVATIGPVLRQDGRRLFRVWGIGLPVAVLGGFAVSQLAQLGLAATDELCSVLLAPLVSDPGSRYTAAIGNILQYPVFVQAVVGMVAVAGGLALWLELLLRSAAVYLTVFLMPLALAAYIWPATASMARRAVEALAALVLSKLVIVAALVLGVGAVASGGVSAPVTGAALLLMAAFAPFAVLRLAPVVESASIAHLEGMARRPARAAARTATAASGAPRHPVVQAALAQRNQTTLQPAPVKPQSIPEHEASFRSPPPASAVDEGGSK